MIAPDSCTKCGRRFGSDETFHLRQTKTNEGILTEFICPLHTDHDVAGNWHDES